jgi:hypothetical protein
VVHDEVDDDAKATVVGCVKENLKVLNGAQLLTDPAIVTNVVTSVMERRVIEGW